MNDADEDIRILEKHIAQLGEHYDTVQIFVTKYIENKDTINAYSGTGNYFARFGQIFQWIERQKIDATSLSND